jgi:hypothetical protein
VGVLCIVGIGTSWTDGWCGSTRYQLSVKMCEATVDAACRCDKSSGLRGSEGRT